MSTTPPSPSGGGVSGLVSQVLSYIDKPWKAVVIVALFLVGGLGWTLYEKRDELIESWLTPSAAGLRVADVPAALDALTTNGGGGADMVQIWAIDLSANSQKFIGARRSDGERPVVPTPRRLPVVISTSDVKSLVNVLEGSPVCVDIDPGGSPIMRRLAERGMKRGCAIPIPPSPDAFVGVIYLSWVKAVDASTENVAIAAAREVAAKLVTR